MVTTLPSLALPSVMTSPNTARTFAAALPRPSQMVSARALFSVVSVSRLFRPSRNNCPTLLMSTFAPLWLVSHSSCVASVTWMPLPSAKKCWLTASATFCAASATPCARATACRTTLPAGEGLETLERMPIAEPSHSSVTVSPTLTPAATLAAGASPPSPVVTHVVPSASMRVTVASVRPRSGRAAPMTSFAKSQTALGSIAMCLPPMLPSRSR